MKHQGWRWILGIIVWAMTGAVGLAQATRRVPDKPAVVAAPSVAVLHNPAPEYLSGEVSIAVRANENPLIRLGLAQHGVTLVEFPANDRFFAINPGNPDLVTIEDSPTKATDHFFVLRAGSSFMPAHNGTAPATTLIVQMNSGMVVTLLLSPMRDIERNAHRCVITYDRDAVVQARQAAGLAVHLDRPTDRLEETSKVKAVQASLRVAPISEAVTVAPKTPEKNDPKKEETSAVTVDPNQLQSSLPQVIAKAETEFDPAYEAEKRHWSKPRHGLAIAAQTRILNAQQRQVAVTIRNTARQALQLAPEQPALIVWTLDGKGRVLQTETIAPLKAESDLLTGILAPGQTTRVLLNYAAPILGARQRLCVAVAQINAADEPVTLELSAGLR